MNITKKEYKKLKLNLLITNIGFFVLFVFILILLYFSNNYISNYAASKQYNTIIDTSQLNPDETQLAVKILNDLDKNYLNFTSKVVFTKNIQRDYQANGGEEGIKELDSLAGFDKHNTKEVYIEYTDDEYFLREVLCHELLHNILKATDAEHPIVYQLGAEQVCFKSKINILNI